MMPESLKKRRLEPLPLVKQEFERNCFPMEFESMLKLLCEEEERLSVEQVSLEPIACELESMCAENFQSEVIVSLGHEFPRFKICSPSLKEKLGYSPFETEMSLADILAPADVHDLVQELKLTLFERKQFQAMNGNKALLQFCMESSTVERKLLFSKSGEITECITRNVMTFSKQDPTELESFTMYIFWP